MLGVKQVQQEALYQVVLARINAEQHDAHWWGVVTVEDQGTEVFVQRENNAIGINSTLKDFWIWAAAAMLDHPSHIKTPFPQSPHCGSGEVLIRKERHAGMRYGLYIVMSSSTSEA